MVQSQSTCISREPKYELYYTISKPNMSCICCKSYHNHGYFNTFADSLDCDPEIFTVLPAKSGSDVMFCLQSYQGLIIEISLSSVLILSTG